MKWKRRKYQAEIVSDRYLPIEPAGGFVFEGEIKLLDSGSGQLIFAPIVHDSAFVGNHSDRHFCILELHLLQMFGFFAKQFPWGFSGARMGGAIALPIQPLQCSTVQ